MIATTDSRRWLPALVPIILLLAGCETSADPSLPVGSQAYAQVPPATAGNPTQDYRISPLDTLSITVFQEPSLTFTALPVDASGNITMPLIGSLTAAGRTSEQLAQAIAAKYDQSYLKGAQVSVQVTESVAQRITVEGNVTQPGVYEISGSSSLLQALALAKSPTRVAKLNQVIIFRYVDGHREGAVFDVSRIRQGRDPDPEVLGGDTIVVGFSAVKGAFRDFLTTAPFFTVFRYF